MGDANLDGVVNATDAIQMARNYLIAGRSGWDLGNFNYDSGIDYSDALILQKNFNGVANGSAFRGGHEHGGSGVCISGIGGDDEGGFEWTCSCSVRPRTVTVTWL